MTDVTVTAEQLEEAIANALHAHDVRAVEPLLHSLALLDPKRAEVVMDTLRLAVDVAKRRAPSQSSEQPGENLTCGFTFAQTAFPQVSEPVPTDAPRLQPLSFPTRVESPTSKFVPETASDLRVQKEPLVKWGMRDTQRQRAYDAEFAMRAECRGREYVTVKECQRRVDRILASAWWKERSRVRHVEIGDGRGHRRAVSYGGFVALPKWARCDLVIMHELAHEGMPRGEKHGAAWARMFYDLMRRFMSREIADRFLVECAARNVKVAGKRLPRSKVTDEQRVVRDKQRAERRTPKFTVFCAEHGQHPSNVGYCVRCRADERGQSAFVTDRFGWSEWRIAAADDRRTDDTQKEG